LPTPTWTPSDFSTERALRLALRKDLSTWATLALADRGQAPARHHRLIMAELESLAAGHTDRLMLLLPPGSAKSTYASLLFPPWWLARNPGSSIIAASHTASLARHFGRGVRGLIDQHGSRLGFSLDPTSRAAHNFTTSTGAEYFATGIRGPVMGRRADLILIDDPVKSQAEADSPAARDHLWSWFRSDLITRLKPGGRMILIMTRWHPDDLGGRIEVGPDPWRVLRLPALAELGDPLGREPGEALWPEWESAEALARKRAVMDERAFAALFQQSPTLRTGRLFHPAKMPILTEPGIGPTVRAWDLAATAAAAGRDPDYTVGLKLTRDQNDAFCVLDVVRLRGGPHEVEAAILATAAADGVGVTIGLPQDPGQAGRAQIRYLTGRLAGYRVVSSPETGAKETRAMPAASQANGGNLALRRAPWNRSLLEELQDFPHGAKDDQVDALSRAFAMLTDHPKPTHRANLPYLAR
jgi:predicted phage terminase large subunit-like protein